MAQKNGTQSDSQLNIQQNEPLNQQTNWKRIFGIMIFMMLILLSVTSVYFPRMLGWYFEPPMAMGISCSGSIQWALNRLLVAQLISIGIGAVLGFFLGWKFRKK